MGLVRALESGDCVLFVGAGAGYNYTNEQGHVPSGVQLGRLLAERFGIDLGEEEPDLAAIGELIEVRHDRRGLENAVGEFLSGFEPDESFRQLLRRGWKAIFTTNYDGYIERAYELEAEPSQLCLSYSVTSDLRAAHGPDEVPVYHLHGSLLAGGEDRHLVITQTDYTRYAERRRMLFDHLRAHHATDTLLYVGYSHNDSNWRALLAELRQEFQPAVLPPAYRLAPTTPALQRELLASQGVQTLDGDIAELAEAVALVPRLPPATGSASPGLRPLEEANGVATRRLSSAWELVNDSDLAAGPNVKEFFRGSPANWALVGQGINFERDIEQGLVEDLLDYVTGQPDAPAAHKVLGTAGAGTSTLLRAIAAWMARERACSVFYLRPGATVRPGDLEFVSRRLGACVWIVDDAADHVEEIVTALAALRQNALPAALLIGERINEWRERRGRVSGKEHLLQSLSDVEIERLLVALESNHELGALADLSHDARFASIKVRNSKELLVSLREVTEGVNFDAIIESEYYGIIDERARRAYLAVSCFSRAKALMRPDLLAGLLQLNVADLYGQVLPSLEGVLRVVDLARDHEALEARHHSIGDIVWSRCGDSVERSAIALKAMRALNLSYGVDAKAFEAMTRNESLIDDMESLDAKTAFFETALRKDPDSPYVRQHYARMLRRADRPEMALAQIEAGLGLNAGLRVLVHTKGVILRDIALAASSIDLGRRYLAQSEAAFEQALAMHERDEYSYTSLAELYLGWAKRLEGELDSVLYLTKAEETVQRGLAAARDREGLYVVAAKIEAFSGDTPAQIDNLRRALAENPAALVARYLLGTALRGIGDLEASESVLREGLLVAPDHVRLATSLALTLLARERPLREAVAVLKEAAHDGRRDHRFVALYGGLLELHGQLAESARVFTEARKRAWSSYELHRAVYQPQGVGHRRASVVRNLGAYAFLRAPGHNDIFCSARKFPREGLEVGRSVNVLVGYDVRGPHAVEVQLLPPE